MKPPHEIPLAGGVAQKEVSPSMQEDPIRALAVQAQYELLVDRLRHAVQYQREALKATEEALKLVENRG
jgi:hypothetical protein